MKKYFWLLLVQLLFTACTTIEHVPSNTSVFDVAKHDENIVRNEDIIQSTVDIPSSEEKLKIISLFEIEKQTQLSLLINRLDIDFKELTCMAEVMYFEARGEGKEGMLAVGYVVMNRTMNPQFPNTVCGVVRQGKHVKGKPVKNRCQFSWYCDNKPDIIKDKEAYEIALEFAASIFTGESSNPVGKSTHFHATYVRPRWSRIFMVVRRVGKHIFYV
jgi:hypothetical protein